MNYFGCSIYASGDVGKEFLCRLGDAARTWKKLRLFWKSAARSPKWNLRIHDAVTRSKLVYRLGTVALAQGQMARVGALPLRGLRLILKIRHPHIDRTNNTDRVMELSNSHRFPKGGLIQPCSEDYKAQRLTFFGHVLRTLPGDYEEG